MGNMKAQISIEYLIIVGFVLAAILIPAFLLLFSSTYKNVYGPVNVQKINDLGNGLTNDAKQMYYLGIYSKKIVKYEMPENVADMFILNMTNSSANYYYVGIIINDSTSSKMYTFISSVPLTSDINNNNVIHDQNLSRFVLECIRPGSGYTCNFYSFIGPTIMPGMKTFAVETISDGNNVRSSIVPYSQ